MVRLSGPMLGIGLTCCTVGPDYQSPEIKEAPRRSAPDGASVPSRTVEGAVDIVRPDVTRAYMQRQCKAGSKVTMVWVPDVGHGFIAARSAAAAVGWMMDRCAGQPAPSVGGTPRPVSRRFCRLGRGSAGLA